LLIFFAEGCEYFTNIEKNWLHWFDVLIIGLSIWLEIAFADSPEGGLLIIARLWRLVRVGEGVFEAVKHGGDEHGSEHGHEDGHEGNYEPPEEKRTYGKTKQKYGGELPDDDLGVEMAGKRGGEKKQKTGYFSTPHENIDQHKGWI